MDMGKSFARQMEAFLEMQFARGMGPAERGASGSWSDWAKDY